MLSYPIDEAEALLSSKLAAAKQSLANCEEDLDFLREQITVSHPIKLVQELCLFEIPVTNYGKDYGGSNSESVQLGCDNETKREK